MKAEYITHMGDDLMVVNAARVSFDKASEWEEFKSLARDGSKPVGPLDYDPFDDRVWYIKRLLDRDERLIKYLATHGHWTPFAHPQITLRMTAPIFVRTQCFKHKVGFTENEVSRRYVTSEPEFWLPEKFRLKADNKKQGSSEEFSSLSPRRELSELYAQALETYNFLIEQGVCGEQARACLPQSMMTQWYWTGSLAAYARFVRQRTDPHAQQEVRELATKVADIIEPLFPVSWKYLTGAVDCTKGAE